MRPAYGYRYTIRGIDRDGVRIEHTTAYRFAREIVDAYQEQGEVVVMECETCLSTRIRDRYERERRRLVDTHELIEHPRPCAFPVLESILCGYILPDVAQLADRYNQLLVQAYERESP